MSMLVAKLQKQNGTSFLEVIIALVLMGIITTAIFQVYVAQHKNYLVQEDVTEIQQSARASVDVIATSVRMAGYQIPENILPIVPENTNPDTITVVYLIGDCLATLSEDMSGPSAELHLGTSDISCFQDGQRAYIYELQANYGEWFDITSVDTDQNRFRHQTMELSRNYNTGSNIYSLNEVKFYIDNTTDPDHPCLMLQLNGESPQVFAENISDLQFQYKMKNGMISDEPIMVNDVREVSISLTGHSNHPDYDQSTDTLRTRTFTTKVSVRNLSS